MDTASGAALSRTGRDAARIKSSVTQAVSDMHAIPSRPGFWRGGLTCFGLAAAAFYMGLHAPRSTLPTILPTAAQPTLVVPLAFERNLGQSDPAVDFVSCGCGYTL